MPYKKKYKSKKTYKKKSYKKKKRAAPRRKRAPKRARQYPISMGMPNRYFKVFSRFVNPAEKTLAAANILDTYTCEANRFQFNGGRNDFAFADTPKYWTGFWKKPYQSMLIHKSTLSVQLTNSDAQKNEDLSIAIYPQREDATPLTSPTTLENLMQIPGVRIRHGRSNTTTNTAITLTYGLKAKDMFLVNSLRGNHPVDLTGTAAQNNFVARNPPVLPVSNLDNTHAWYWVVYVFRRSYHLVAPTMDTTYKIKARLTHHCEMAIPIPEAFA